MGKAFFSRRYAIDRAGVAAFYHNRAWRICPLYFLVVAVSCLFQCPIVFERAHWGTLLRMLTFTYSAQGNVNPRRARCGPYRPKCSSTCWRPVIAWIAMRWAAGGERRARALVAVVGCVAAGICLRGILWRVCHASPAFWATYIYKPIWMNLDLFTLGLLMNYWTSPASMKLRGVRTEQRRAALAAVVLVSFNMTLGYLTWRGFTLGQSPRAMQFFVDAGPTCTALVTCLANRDDRTTQPGPQAGGTLAGRAAGLGRTLVARQCRPA